MSRQMTMEECRDALVKHALHLAKHWAAGDVPKDIVEEYPEKFKTEEARRLYACEGVVFSLLVTLDGEDGSLPGWIVAPNPAEEDKEYHQEEGENWWPHPEWDMVDVAGGLHDQLHRFKRPK